MEKLLTNNIPPNSPILNQYTEDDTLILYQRQKAKLSRASPRFYQTVHILLHKTKPLPSARNNIILRAPICQPHMPTEDNNSLTKHPNSPSQQRVLQYYYTVLNPENRRKQPPPTQVLTKPKLLCERIPTKISYVGLPTSRLRGKG